MGLLITHPLVLTLATLLSAAIVAASSEASVLEKRDLCDLPGAGQLGQCDTSSTGVRAWGGPGNPIACAYCPSRVENWADGTGNFWTATGISTAKCAFNANCSCCPWSGTKPTPESGYVGGTCTMQVVQTPPFQVTPDGSLYNFTVTLFDANTPPNVIGYGDLDNVYTGETKGLDSVLPDVFEVTNQGNTTVPVGFAYAGQTWASDDQGAPHFCTGGSDWKIPIGISNRPILPVPRTISCDFAC